MNHSQLAHVWANQTKAKGKGSSMFFEGPTIYSYGTHFPIATFVENTKREKAVLFTRAGYSHTTECHKSEVRHALLGLDVPVFYVDGLSYHYVRAFEWTNKTFLREAFKATVKLAEAEAIKAKRARKYGGLYLDAARELLAEAQNLSKFFKLGLKVPAEEKLAPESLLKKIDEAKKAEAKRKKEREAKQRAEDAARFEAWRQGANTYCPSSYQTDENGSAYLRIGPYAQKIVETSRGAQVSLEEATKAFRFVKLCRMTGREFKANGTQVPVGAFSLRSIDENGNVQVGCHYFTWSRIEEFAKAAGIFDLEASPEALKQTEAFA